MTPARAVPTRAERREATVTELVRAAERLFVERGFHATSVDQVAAEAGYTKGAVYSNFASKEDLFLAVYARRAAAVVAQVEATVAELGDAEALHRLAADSATRRGRDDGWLAVVFEFWAHVVRNPASRERLAELRREVRRPVAAALERLAAERGGRLPLAGDELAAAMGATQMGLALERLIDPGHLSPDVGELVSRAALDHLLGSF